MCEEEKTTADEAPAAKRPKPPTSKEVGAVLEALAGHVRTRPVSQSKLAKACTKGVELLSRGLVCEDHSEEWFSLLSAAADAVAELRSGCEMHAAPEPCEKAWTALIEAATSERGAVPGANWSEERRSALDAWNFERLCVLELHEADDALAFAKPIARARAEMERNAPMMREALCKCVFAAVNEATSAPTKVLWAPQQALAFVRFALAKGFSSVLVAAAETRLMEATEKRRKGNAPLASKFDMDTAKWRAADVSVSKRL